MLIGIRLWAVLFCFALCPGSIAAATGAKPNFRSQALREGDWKLVIHHDATKKGAPAQADKVELFDFAKDSSETQDLAGKLPDRVTALRARLAEASKADRDSQVND